MTDDVISCLLVPFLFLFSAPLIILFSSLCILFFKPTLIFGSTMSEHLQLGVVL
jgi:hypothetical protein